MKISVVLPVYNVEKFLPLCLDSVKNQTLRDIEIICVDDGSTDQSGAICDRYAAEDERFRVIHKKNEGYGVAMNAGIEAATGEYFAILETDDFIQPTMYETLYRTAKEYDAEIVRSNYYDLTTPDGKNHLQPQVITTDEEYYNRVICPNEEPVVYTFVMHNWTGIYRMDFLNQNHIRYNTTPGASYQDNGFFFQAFSACRRLVYAKEHFYCYRIDNPASSINSPEKVYTHVKEFDFIREKLTETGTFEKLKPVYYNRLFRAYHQTYQRIGEKYKEEYLNSFQKAFCAAEHDGLIDWHYFDAYQRYMFGFLMKSKRDYAAIAAPHRSFLQKLTVLKCKIFNLLKGH